MNTQPFNNPELCFLCNQAWNFYVLRGGGVGREFRRKIGFVSFDSYKEMIYYLSTDMYSIYINFTSISFGFIFSWPVVSILCVLFRYAQTFKTTVHR